MGSQLRSEGGGPMSNLLKLAAFHWAFAAVHNIRIQVPWDENQPQYGKYHLASAKGTYRQVLDYAEANCPLKEKGAIEQWMKGANPQEIHVGIDCSGFVYRTLDEACRVSGAPSLLDTLGTPCEYTALDTLTQADQVIRRARDVRAGDTMRFNKGRHSGVIIETVYNVDGVLKQVWYAHSSFTRGPHVAHIEIGDPNAPLNDQSQNWFDAMWDWYDDNNLRDGYFTSVHHSPFYNGPRIALVRQDDIQVALDDDLLEFEVAPFVLGGRTLCQIRPVAEALGAKVTWTQASQTITCTLGDRKVTCQLGSEMGYINGEQQLLDEPPMLYDDHTVVPLRFIAEGLGLEVTWDGANRTVHLRRK